MIRLPLVKFISASPMIIGVKIRKCGIVLREGAFGCEGGVYPEKGEVIKRYGG